MCADPEDGAPSRPKPKRPNSPSKRDGTSNWPRSQESYHQGSRSHNLERVEESPTSVQPQVPKPQQCASTPPRLIGPPVERKMLSGTAIRHAVMNLPSHLKRCRPHDPLHHSSLLHRKQAPLLAGGVAVEIVIAGLQQKNRVRVIFHAQCDLAPALESIWTMVLLASIPLGSLQHGLVALSHVD